jgi:DNA-binding NarL/FixJ family response regulator
MRLIMFNDEPLVAAALTSVLQGADDIELVQVLESISEVVPAVLEEQPDLLLLCLTPEIHASVIRQLRQASPECRIVLWIHSISNELAHQAMEIGVRGILRRTYAPEMILKCLRKVHAGEMWFDRFLMSSFMACRKVHLTRREGQLVRLLADGLKNKEIATALSISEGTVKVYLSRLFDKVGAKDRYELALFSLRNLGGLEQAAGTEGMENEELRVLYLESRLPELADRKPPAMAPPYRNSAAVGRRSGLA